VTDEPIDNLSARDDSVDASSPLTEGWPNEPENDDLAYFLRELDRRRPELSPQALERVQQAMRRELKRRHTGSAAPVSRRPFGPGTRSTHYLNLWAVAILVTLIVLCLWVMFYLRPKTPSTTQPLPGQASPVISTSHLALVANAAQLARHPFTAPLVSPAMKSLCSTKNSPITGKMLSSVPAISIP